MIEYMVILSPAQITVNQNINLVLAALKPVFFKWFFPFFTQVSRRVQRENMRALG